VERVSGGAGFFWSVEKRQLWSDLVTKTELDAEGGELPPGAKNIVPGALFRIAQRHTRPTMSVNASYNSIGDHFLEASFEPGKVRLTRKVTIGGLDGNSNIPESGTMWHVPYPYFHDRGYFPEDSGLTGGEEHFCETELRYGSLNT